MLKTPLNHNIGSVKYRSCLFVHIILFESLADIISKYLRVLFFNLSVWRLLLRQVKNVTNDRNFNEKKTEEKEMQLD